MKISKEILFKYSLGEDIANGVTHGVGAFISFFLYSHLIVVAARNGSWVEIVSFGFFGLSMFLLFLSSSLYHSIWHYGARNVLKRIDHAMIYILILGSYTPLVFVVIDKPSAVVIYIALFLLTVFGVVFKSLYAHKYKIISTFVYIAMGWVAIFMIKDMISSLSKGALFFMLLGGIVYSVGALIYAFAKFKYHHMVWHLFVMGGAYCHYIAIAFYIF